MEFEEEKQKLLDVYDSLLFEEVKYLKELYKTSFKNFTQKEIIELYKTYYAKTKMSPAFVYFIHNKYTNLIKIGKSTNPFKRLDELNSMFKNHFGVDDALSMVRVVFIPSGQDYKVEKMYHQKYESYRTFGEWFNVSQDEICNMFPEFINYDTDGFLKNEGFNSDINFLDVDDFSYVIFALDMLDAYTLKIVNGNKESALYFKKLVHNEILKKYNVQLSLFLGHDVRNWDSPFSSESKNKTWEMFKWLCLNRDAYALSTHYKLNENDEITKKLFSFNKNAEILDYYQLIEKMVNDICYVNFNAQQIKEEV